MSTTSPITRQQSSETEIASSSLPFAPQSATPQSPQPLSPQSLSSAGPGACSPLSFQSPVHSLNDAPSVRANSGSSEEIVFEGYVARRSAILKRWKNRKLITVVKGISYSIMHGIYSKCKYNAI